MRRIIIVKRQFNLINQQITDNYPHESGGFFGGKYNVVLGVFPIANKTSGETAQGKFSITEDDIYFAQKFFKDNNLNIMGMYHSHPNGAPIPSGKDMSHLVGDKFGRMHLILAIRPQNPLRKKFNATRENAAYQVQLGLYYCPSPREKIPLDLKIIENNQVSRYLHAENEELSDLALSGMVNEYLSLEAKIAQMVQYGRIDYKKDDSHGFSQSSFRTDT